MREWRIQTFCLIILTAIAVAASLYWLRPVMIPLVLAVFFSLGLSLISDVLVRRLSCPRILAMIVTLLFASFLAFLLLALISGSVRQLAGQADAYQSSIDSMKIRMLERLEGPLEKFGVETEEVDKMLAVPTSAIGNVLLTTTNTILEIVKQSVLVLIFVFFLLIGRGSVRGPSVFRTEIEARVKRYLVTKAGASAATGFLVGFILSILDVQLAMVFGLAAFLLNFIPSVGSIIATLLPLPVVIIDPDLSFSVRILALVLPGAVQITIGNFVEPKILGDSLDLHPVAILSALIFWGMLWGIVGMFLAVPMTAILKILLERYSYTAPFAHVLAGKFDHLGL